MLICLRAIDSLKLIFPLLHLAPNGLGRFHLNLLLINNLYDPFGRRAGHPEGLFVPWGIQAAY